VSLREFSGKQIRWVKVKACANHALQPTWLSCANSTLLSAFSLLASDGTHAAATKRLKAIVSTAVAMGRVVV